MSHNYTTTFFSRLKELFITSLKLGLTSFGGPTAHLAYFHEEYVKRKKWLDEIAYADLVALCQFLPGPASSQVGISIGIMRAGLLGGFVSFLGFTLPSILIMYIFAQLFRFTPLLEQGWVQGLKLAAVVIVLQAIIGMGSKLANTKNTATLATLTAFFVSIWPNSAVQIASITLAGFFGLFFLKPQKSTEALKLPILIKKTTALLSITLFLLLLLILPLLSDSKALNSVTLFDSFYRSGALVFGGGHVVMPLLEKELVPQGFIDKDSFMAGYAAAQAIPGPLFTFATYLGGVINGWKGALITTVAVFMPAFLLVTAALPFWNVLRQNVKMQAAMNGMNAAVVGLLIAALYNPLFVHTIVSPNHFALAAVLFVLVQYWKLPPWLTILISALTGILIL